MIKTAYGFNQSDFCVYAEKLQITKRTDSSRINYSNGYIKTSGCVFTVSAHVIVCFYLVLDGRCSINFHLKPLSLFL